MLQIYETKRIVEMVKEIAMQLRKDEIDIEVVNEISGVMIEINSLLYHATKLKFQKNMISVYKRNIMIGYQS